MMCVTHHGFLLPEAAFASLSARRCLCRTGVKASKSYRVYSNAFMEGRPQSETGPRNYLRPGIPSIHPGAGGPQSTAMAARRVRFIPHVGCHRQHTGQHCSMGLA